MTRLVLAIALAAAALLAPAAAVAHPLGNFTTNRHALVQPSGDRLYVRYVLDLAEIPAFQERQRMGDRDAYAGSLAARIAKDLAVTVDGTRLRLRPTARKLTFPPGAGDLRTLRFEAVYAAELPAGQGERRLAYADTNFPNRIGWREVVLRPGPGARMVSASVPEQSLSDELRTYPEGLLESPVEVDSAEAVFVAGGASGVPLELSSGAAVTRGEGSHDGFAGLVTRTDLGGGFIVLSLFLAMFWGAAHAFSPGHGKAIVAGYLVGSRGTPRHAFALGGIVTVTHTIGVFAVGLVTLALSEFVLPEQLYPWLNLVAALLVVAVGVGVVRWRIRDWRRSTVGHGHHHHGHHHHGDGHQHHHHHHHHHHGDGHHDHGHHHHGRAGGGVRGLVGAGISGGIIPCPTALVVLLAAISLQRVGYGLVLIIAFSIGLAASVTGIGLLAVTAKQAFSRVRFENRAIRLLPSASAVVVLALGLVMTTRALPPLL